MSSTLHYGGSFGAKSFSSHPAKQIGRPSQNTSFAAQKRFEMMCRMENAGIPDSATAPMLGISVSRLRYLKRLPDYLIVRMRITHGIILDNDAKIAEIKEQRKEILIGMLPAALQTLANTLLSQPQSYADRKLQVDVAKDVLDRSDIYAKVSRTELKPVSFFDFEKSDKDSADILSQLKLAGASAPQEKMKVNEAFQSSSDSLSEEQQQAALADLEDLNFNVEDSSGLQD